MVHTEAEQILGMADMKGTPNLIVIQITRTESHSRKDQTPGPVSTLTGLRPGL